MSEKLEKLGGYVVQGVDFPQNLDLVLGSGLKATVDETEKTLTISNDATVLWEGTEPADSNVIVLSEAANNFEYLKIELKSTQNADSISYHEIAPTKTFVVGRHTVIPNATYKMQLVAIYYTGDDYITYRFNHGYRWYGNTNIAGGDESSSAGGYFTDGAWVSKVIGIGRKQA